MAKHGRYSVNDTFCSVIYGNGLYEETGEYIADPLKASGNFNATVPVLTNIISGELYYVKKLEYTDFLPNYLIQEILMPAERELILWPVDIIAITDEQSERINLCVAHQYNEAADDFYFRLGNYAALFPLQQFPVMESATMRLLKSGELSWRNKSVCEIAIKIVSAIHRLNKSGYYYNDIHLDNFYFAPDNKLLVDYSAIVFPINAGDDNKLNSQIIAFQGEIPLEFMEPAIIQEKHRYLDYATQNYSLSALLFYLFFGRYPYDGRLLTGYRDNDVQSHYVKFRDYHKMPIFIFDPTDNRNAIGAFDEDKGVIELWDESPEQIKSLCIRALNQDNAERAHNPISPTPEEWIRCFTNIGWK